MPRIYVAYRTDATNLGDRLASGSNTTIRKNIAEFPNSNWALAFYSVKIDTKTLCQLFTDATKIPHVSIENVRVTDTGRVQKVL